MGAVLSGAATAPPQNLSCGSTHGMRSTPFVSRYQSGNPLLGLTGPTVTMPWGPPVRGGKMPVGAAIATAPAVRTRNVDRATILVRVRAARRRPSTRFITPVLG